jgi:hypothetical protein
MAVAEVECAIATLDQRDAESRAIAHAALSDGNRPEWMMADAEREVTGWNLSKLKSLLATRMEGASIARKKFIESRCEHEQVKELVKNAHQAALLDEVRRAQASADDWFLSRRKTEEL